MKKIADNKMSINKLLAVILLCAFYFQYANTQNNDNNSSKSSPSKNPNVWTNYNFVPGDKIIFQDDLIGEENGEFPSRWDLIDGNAENAVLGEENIINFKNKSIIAPLMEGNEYLPDVFTIEFDVYFGDKKGPFTWQYYGIRFTNSTGGWYYPDPKKKDYYYPIQIYQHGAYLSAQINNVNKEFKTYEETLKEDGALWRHVSIAFNKRSLKVFVDQHRVLNIPNLGFQPKVFNLSAWSYYDDNFIRAIKNIRVAEGGKKLYDRIIAEGKFVTRGILFDINKATLKPESMGVINEVSKMMQKHKDLSFSIEGHTDSDGADDYNLELSRQRAETVKTALIGLGIDKNRFQTKGLGESVPVAENNSPEGRANNRRVEFIKLKTVNSEIQQLQPSEKGNEKKKEKKINKENIAKSLNVCSYYEPTKSGGSLSGTWENWKDEDEFNFTVPNDPGGGDIEITHKSPSPIIPTMFSNVSPRISGTISGGSAAQSNNERVRRDVFEVAAGQSYHVQVAQFFKAKAEFYPIAYAGGWTFHSRIDCYEPNNNINEAKMIPLNEVLEAYSIAGYKDYFIRSGDSHTYDWYSFELKESADIGIELLQVAKNQQMNFRLLNDDEKVIYSVSAKKGKLLTHHTSNMTPGKYYLAMHPVHDTRKANLLMGEEIPDHFNTPYKFRINVK